MGCLYGEGPVSKCQCKCNGYTHGLMTPQGAERAYCTPAVATRCQNGHEEECQCACGGLNHGLYRHIEHFEDIRITGLTDALI